MAEPRQWPALDVHSAAVDETGEIGGMLTALLADYQPIAIQDLIPPPLPPGGLWDPTSPPPPDPPPSPIAWRVCFAEVAMRDAALAAIRAHEFGLTAVPVDLPDDDWVTRSQAALMAVRAGRFVVAPPWDIPSSPPADTHVLVIEPSMGFGTGHHQTTRLCLAALSDLPVAGRSVLDLGTGSGVLAMAAAMLGARDVRGTDIDADAIAAALRSAALNPLPTPVRFETADLFAAPAAPAEIVVANLTGAMLIKAAAPLEALVAPGGLLVVSGFMEYEREGVEAALTAFDVQHRTREDEWSAGVLRRR